ncbi:hypothetical protein MFLO_00435 [Listeria floridensis FSL S10-1187]|uniref:Pseudouridine synthase n=1 Tax=Listeria floridensis FSL S10-1187 TaxID=1265817 RepID=A0ABN0RIL0_9LIST|nr:hypothetical protein MFLO_00435 [Listeria floridensis FSL S10-1187]
MRLDKLLAHAGYGTRKDVKTVLKKKEVTVNGLRVRDGAQKIDPERDQVIVSGQLIDYAAKRYFMLHKPSGVISATEDERSRTVLDLFQPEDRFRGLFPVGRLDKDTEGLLLITNDGDLAHRLLAPKKHVDKVYFAKVTGKLTDEDVTVFEKGVTFLDGYAALPAELTILTATEVKSEARVTIHEGKFHQVKKNVRSARKKK